MNLSVRAITTNSRMFSAMQSQATTSFNSATQSMNDEKHHHSKNSKHNKVHHQPQELSGKDFFKILNMNSKKKKNNSKK